MIAERASLFVLAIISDSPRPNNRCSKWVGPARRLISRNHRHAFDARLVLVEPALVAFVILIKGVQWLLS
jgi:hypothetical protein